MITLIIVDCQNDFITGTMAVKGARNAVDEIKKFIKRNVNEIDKILFTIDWHPYNHCSFKRYGGVWPHHCIQYTPGACIEPKLLKYVQSLDINYEVCEKGKYEDIEEYGAFNEIEYVSDSLNSKFYFDSLYSADANTDFVICGIAGDFCVKETIKNLMEEEISPKVFMSGVVSIDGGKSFSDFVKDNHIEKVV